MANAIPHMMFQAIQNYRQVNGYLPGRILIYWMALMGGGGQLQLTVNLETERLLALLVHRGFRRHRGHLMVMLGGVHERLPR